MKSARTQTPSGSGTSSGTGDFLGRMNDPTVAAWLKGPCGDTMECYLVVKDDRIVDIRYYTDGCDSTHACGRQLCAMVLGRTVEAALAISAGDLLQNTELCRPEDRHCAILAVSALYRTIGVYWTVP